MSAPSAKHEERRDDLATVFRLAGMTRPAHLQWWLRPDVSLAAPILRAYSVSATPKRQNGPAIQPRSVALIGYVRAAKRWHQAGWAIHMSLAVEPEDGRAWLAELRSAWTLGGLPPKSRERLSIAPDLDGGVTFDGQPTVRTRDIGFVSSLCAGPALTLACKGDL